MREIAGVEPLTICPFGSHQVQGVVNHAAHQSELAAAREGGRITGLSQWKTFMAGWSPPPPVAALVPPSHRG